MGVLKKVLKTEWPLNGAARRDAPFCAKLATETKGPVRPAPSRLPATAATSMETVTTEVAATMEVSTAAE